VVDADVAEALALWAHVPMPASTSSTNKGSVTLDL
jgi:hypothetical protein